MTSKAMRTTALFMVLAASFNIAMSQNPPAQPPAAGAGAGAGAPPAGPPRSVPDPRVQQRTYLFTDTNEQMPYALFVSSKVTKSKSAPLIVALHGLGGTQNTGWYGMPTGRPPGAGAAGAAPAIAPQGAALNAANPQPVRLGLAVLHVALASAT